MIKVLTLAALLVVFDAAAVEAQRTTERFIPIGRSPGVSGVTAILGPIEAVDRAAGTCRVTTAAGPVTVRITEETRIWIDRSAQQQTTLAGTPEDLVVGRTVEIKFTDAQRRESAEWIKIAQPPGG